MTLSRSVSSGPTTSTSARTASRVVSAPAARTVVSASRVVQSPASSPRVVQRGLAKVITERPRSAAPRTRLVARNDGATNGATTGAVDSVEKKKAAPEVIKQVKAPRPISPEATPATARGRTVLLPRQAVMPQPLRSRSPRPEPHSQVDRGEDGFRVSFAEKKHGEAKKKTNKKSALPFKVISWSSQRPSFHCTAKNLEKQDRGIDALLNGTNQWETDGRPDHFLFLDFGVEVDLSHVQLRCTGTRYDPKNVTILRGVAGITDVITEHLNLSREAQRAPDAVAVKASSLLTKGTWAVVKRASLKSGPDGRDKHAHTLRVHGAQARWLQLVFHESWSSTGNIRLLQPLSVYGSKLHIQPTEAQRRLSLVAMFNERCLLDEAEMETRKLSRDFNIPLDDTHNVRREFLRFDTEKRGYLTFFDFRKVVKALTSRHTLCRADALLQENHLRALWNIVDKDGSGCVEFEEFLQWFHSHFLKEKPPARSLHSGTMVESVTEHFYASMGVNRLRGYLTSFGEGDQEADEDEVEPVAGEDSPKSRKKTVWLRAGLVAATGKGRLVVKDESDR